MTNTPSAETELVEFLNLKIKTLMIQLEETGADKFALLLRLNKIAELLECEAPEIESQIKKLRRLNP